MNKTLVAYFSATGTTARAATALASAIGADLYEIRPAAAYTRADLDWHRKDSRSSLEMRDPSCRPALADQDAGIADYERIFLGFPIWWYTAPRIIQSFLESYDFSKKSSFHSPPPAAAEWVVSRRISLPPAPKLQSRPDGCSTGGCQKICCGNGFANNKEVIK